MDYQVLVKDGHAFRTDKTGDIDAMVLDVEGHNGPECLICDESWCHHCDPQIYEEVCPGRAEPTLDGLEYRQPIAKIVGRRIPL